MQADQPFQHHIGTLLPPTSQVGVVNFGHLFVKIEILPSANGEQKLIDFRDVELGGEVGLVVEASHIGVEVVVLEELSHPLIV